MKIIIVDDEKAILDQMVYILGEAGYAAESAESVEQAVDKIIQMGGLDLLITDVVMESHSGFDLREHLLQDLPNLKTVFITGYDLSEHADRVQGCPVLQKPIQSEVLLRLVKTLAGTIPPQVQTTSVATPAVPTATPVAKPAAPTATPVATPAAVPVAKPATPTATPVAKPTATPVAKPAVPTATPVATPTAVPVAKPAAPTAIPVATPAAVPVAKPAAPTATPVATPTSAPAAVAPEVSAPVSSQEAEQETDTSGGGISVKEDHGEDVKPATKGSGMTANLSHLMQKQGFTGKLDQFQLVDIIQMYCISRRTGRLKISKGVNKGVIFIQEGRIVHAVCGALTAEEAVYEIISWDFGEFEADEGVLTDKRSIQSGWEHIVMEGVRRRDESRHEEGEADADAGLIGKQIGEYQVTRILGTGEWGVAYEANQINMNRQVVLKVLDQEHHLNPEAVQRFIADASAKANVQHASIISVYEAGEANGLYYYTREFIEGHTLEDFISQGTPIQDQVALRVIRVVAESLSYLSHQKIPHDPLDASKIFLDMKDAPRLANLAKIQADQQIGIQKEIQQLSIIVTQAVQEGVAVSPEVRNLLTKMKIDGPAGYLSWGALIQDVRALEPKVVPKDAYKLSEKDEAAIRAVEEERKRQKKAMLYSTLGVFALLWLVVGVLIYKLFFANSIQDFSKMVEVPAGEFIYQDGEKVELPTFWIDRYEVSIGMYKQFLDDLKKNPTTEYDHENQPKGKSHTPLRWDLMWESATKKKVTFDGVNLEINFPIFNIDWYDAYAYAKWKGHRLPTEQEWEKAARGTEGFVYPWGNEYDNKRANSSADYADNPRAPGSIDGYNRWAPVDVMTGDVSPYNALNMAGNVSEWTGTWAPDPRKPDQNIPVVRGGNFHSLDRATRQPDVKVTRRSLVLLPEQPDVRVGFRTVRDDQPVGNER